MSGATPFTIVLGNSKGGTGKSTLAMHVSVALLQAGYRVGTLDLDGRQASFSHYIANRRATAEQQRPQLRIPSHLQLDPDVAAAPDPVAARSALEAALHRIGEVDVLVMDTPGADTALSQAGHILADVLVSPVNDSLMDLDILADIDPVRRKVTAPSHYTKRIWEVTNTRVAAGLPAVDWLLVRNRLSHSDAHNAREIDRLLPKLADRIGFRISPGLRERVIYRELFLEGLTVLDLTPTELSMSHSRRLARDEVLGLIGDIGLALPPGVTAARAPLNSPSPAA